MALARFATGVTVVTTRDAGQRLYGMTVSAFSSVSLEPPLVLICIDKTVGSHDALHDGGVFAVNILTEEQEVIARRFSAKDPDRFNGIAYHDGVGGVPVLEDTLASLECRITQIYEGGDHTIFIGEVEVTSIGHGHPLLYFRGGYASLTM
jgi:flavin reductase (DIM6/NTAB) family NADH-FMN oxidoreductase RutF